MSIIEILQETLIGKKIKLYHFVTKVSQFDVKENFMPKYSSETATIRTYLPERRVNYLHTGTIGTIIEPIQIEEKVYSILNIDILEDFDSTTVEFSLDGLGDKFICLLNESLEILDN